MLTLVIPKTYGRLRPLSNHRRSARAKSYLDAVSPGWDQALGRLKAMIERE